MKSLVKFFIKGGVLAPTDLSKIVEVHDKLGGNHIQFTDRQEVLIQIDSNKCHLVDSIAPTLRFEVANRDGHFNQHNVVSSLLSKRIDESTYWVKQSSYLEILDNTQYHYRLRFNVTDLKQDFVYSFTGDANFVAADETNYWYVYLRDDLKGSQFLLPSMIYSEDVVPLMEYLEANFQTNNADFDKLTTEIENVFGLRSIKIDLEPRVKVSEFNNYEGLHRYNEKYWLGIYMRDFKYSTALLHSLSELCKAQMLGQIHITPWKSIIVKEISSSSLIDWKLFLAEHGVNNGHSEAELHWQIKDFDSEAIEIKNYLRKEFAQKDMNINGAIFGVNIDKEHSFAHIFVERIPVFKYMGRNEVSTYKIVYRQEFNPAKSKFVTYKNLVLRNGLASAISKLMEKYHEKAYREVANFIPKKLQKQETLSSDTQLNEYMYRCKNCYTVYYPEFGDADIAPNTPFKELPEGYCCSICSAPKSEFEEINMSILAV